MESQFIGSCKGSWIAKTVLEKNKAGGHTFAYLKLTRKLKESKQYGTGINVDI